MEIANQAPRMSNLLPFPVANAGQRRSVSTRASKGLVVPDFKQGSTDSIEKIETGPKQAFENKNAPN